MDRIQELNQLIIEYGYIAIFLAVFLQELGVPNPITNELVLLFSGYLAYKGMLSLIKVILIAVSADFTGTCILYFIFYMLSKQYIFKNPPRWVMKYLNKLGNLKQRIENEGQWTIFLGRLTPFVRGYVSVVAGALQIKPKSFLSTVFLSAITWSIGLVLAGRMLGPYWNEVVKNANAYEFLVFVILGVSAMFLAQRYVVSRSR